jgi:hypothetical protein
MSPSSGCLKISSAKADAEPLTNRQEQDITNGLQISRKQFFWERHGSVVRLVGKSTGAHFSGISQ